KPDTLPPSFQQSCPLAPTVRLADIHQQIAAVLHPDIRRDIAVSNRHRARRAVRARRIPNLIVRIELGTNVRRQVGSEELAYAKQDGKSNTRRSAKQLLYQAEQVIWLSPKPASPKAGRLERLIFDLER